MAETTPAAPAPAAALAMDSSIQPTQTMAACPTPITPTPGTQTLRTKASTCAGLGFAEYVPEDYANKAAWPLIIFFHGRAEMGSGSETDVRQLLQASLVRQVQNNAWDPKKRFIVLSPQYNWDDLNPATLKKFMAFAKANYKVDPKRIYLTGLSQGGDPIYLYLSSTNGGDVAAAVPISAVAGNSGQDEQNNPPLYECAYKDVPMWLFHGSADYDVRSQNSLEVYTMLTECKPGARVAPRYTEYTGVEHDAWTRTYNLSGMNTEVQPQRQAYDISVYDWLLQHSKP
jgi:predicted peptidase